MNKLATQAACIIMMTNTGGPPPMFSDQNECRRAVKMRKGGKKRGKGRLK